MHRWHAEINPQHTMLRGGAQGADGGAQLADAVDCVMAASRGFSEDQLSKPVPGRRF